MPLVVPGINSNDGGDLTTQWLNKLAGKKLTDSTSDNTNFAKTDLPKDHRIVAPGSMLTQDHNPDRLNVHVDDEGIVKKVTHG